MEKGIVVTFLWCSFSIMKSGGYHLSSLKGGSPFVPISNGTYCTSIEPPFPDSGSLATKLATGFSVFKNPNKNAVNRR